MSTNQTALIAGASGLVGSHLLEFLLQSNQYLKIYALVRKKLPLAHTKLEQIEFDFDDLEAYKSLPKVDSVFCCLGTTIKQAGGKDNFIKVDFSYPLYLATQTQLSGTKNFSIVTAMGADSKSIIFYNKVKGNVEDAIAHIGFESLNIFRPSLLLGERNETRPGEKAGEVILKLLNPLMTGSLKKYAAIYAKDVAKAMIVAENKGLNIYLSDEIQKLADSSTL
jgi:uncharacterized protein YbjT (DUF2867 family)